MVKRVNLTLLLVVGLACNVIAFATTTDMMTLVTGSISYLLLFIYSIRVSTVRPIQNQELDTMYIKHLIESLEANVVANEPAEQQFKYENSGLYIQVNHIKNILENEYNINRTGKRRCD